MDPEPMTTQIETMLRRARVRAAYAVERQADAKAGRESARSARLSRHARREYRDALYLASLEEA